VTIQEKLKFIHENPAISWHEHVQQCGEGGKELNIAHADHQMEVAETLGIDRMVVSIPLPGDKHCPPEDFRVANDVAALAIKRYPGKVFGMAFVNPGFQKEALEEVERCVNEYGFVGVKLYHHYFMDNPVQYPLVEKCIDLNIPVLMHCGHTMDPATKARQPRISDGVQMANIAKRYPEATFVMGHIGGGGDWQWSLKAIADTPNVFADTGGSVMDRTQLEEAVKYVGAERLIFATDGTWDNCVAKILGSDISVDDKKTILEGTAFLKFLEKGGK